MASVFDAVNMAVSHLMTVMGNELETHSKTQKLRVMAVGGSGVGKSTIGNCFVGGDPLATIFKTGNAWPIRVARWAESDDCLYCDVPAIPAWEPARTKEFYDVIINEARKELSVIFFVFKYGRIDASYFEGKMLYRELKKTKAMTVLVIHDMNNYTFLSKPTEDDYQLFADAIKGGLKLEFTNVLLLTADTMLTQVEEFKKRFQGIKAYASPALMTFEELSINNA